MGIEALLGVDDLAGPLMASAREAWSRWIADDPELGVVEDLADLPQWLVNSAPADRDPPMAKLAALASTDDCAAIALAWLLVPGTKRLAARLAGIAGDVGGLVVGQLWVEIRTGTPPCAYVASTVLRNVERAIKAELGVGDAGERADKTWVATATGDSVELVFPADDESPELQRVLRVVLQHLLEIGEITTPEGRILTSAAGKAAWLKKPMRGRAGLTSPDALEHLTWLEPTKARTMRRDVGKLLDRVSAVAAELDIFELLAQHPDDGVPIHDWVLGLGRPRHEQAARRFRELELEAARTHAATWDEVTGGCAASHVCTACVTAEWAA